MTNSKDFLPEDYTVPDKSNGYMKFKLGINRFRILTSPIIGWEYWVDEGDKRMPKRLRQDDEVPSAVADEVKHFWAMPVWNYEVNQIQILEITQKGIQKTLASYARNPKWGPPFSYDITIERSGEGLDTEYVVDHDPKEELSDEIKAVVSKVNINLEALYDGLDPFAKIASEEQLDEVSDEEINAVFSE